MARLARRSPRASKGGRTYRSNLLPMLALPGDEAVHALQLGRRVLNQLRLPLSTRTRGYGAGLLGVLVIRLLEAKELGAHLLEVAAKEVVCGRRRCM